MNSFSKSESLVVAAKEKALVRRPKRESLEKAVPLQVMIPPPIRKQIAVLSAERGESLRVTVLRGLKAIGVRVPETELADRRGRRTRG